MLELNKIYCMDNLKFLKQIDNNSIDLVLTDPPYAMKYKSNFNRQKDPKYIKSKKINWDNEIPLFINECLRVLKDNSMLLSFGNYKSISKNIERQPDDVLIWNKKDYGLGNLKWFAPSYEMIAIYKKGNPSLNFEKRPRNVLEFYKEANFSNRNNINNKQSHPTQKPLKLILELIKICSKENDIILDCFMGSGTTALAAKNLNRNFIGCDILPDYVKIAQKRLIQTNLTNKLYF